MVPRQVGASSFAIDAWPEPVEGRFTLFSTSYGPIVPGLCPLLHSAGKGLPVDDIEGDQVDVDRMRIFRGVVYLPHLHVIQPRILRDGLEESPSRTQCPIHCPVQNVATGYIPRRAQVKFVKCPLCVGYVVQRQIQR